MRKTIGLGVFVTILAAAVPLLAQDKPILAVMDVEDKTGKFKRGDLEGATDYLRTKLVESGRYQVVDKTRQGEKRTLVAKDLRRESHSPCYDRTCRIKLGQALAADRMLACAVTAVGSTCILGCEVTKLETEAVVTAASARFKCNADALLGGVGRAAVRLAGGKGKSPSPEDNERVVEGKIGGTPEEWQPEAAQRVIVKLSSTPAGAVVLADGKLLCQTTPCSKTMTTGSHEISMEIEGDRYLPKKDVVTVGKGVSVDWKLTPNFGLLTVKSEPSGLDVKVDGKVVGKTPLEKLEVSIGGHEVLVTSKCHYDAGERVNVERGRQRNVLVAAKERQGAIAVEASNAAGNSIAAKVYVDEQLVGRAPGVFKVSVCARTLTVVRTGYMEFTKTVSLQERRTTDVAATLRALPDKESKGIVAKKLKTPFVVRTRKKVKVRNVAELFRAIASNTTVVLAPGTYVLSEKSEGRERAVGVELPKGSAHLAWHDVHDGPELHLKELHNLRLVGSKAGKVRVVVAPRYADVLHFENCSGIQIENIALGHLVPGHCMGAVLVMEDCKDVVVSRSTLFGSGAYGLILRSVVNFFFDNSIIEGCTYGILGVEDSARISFRHSVFRDNEEFGLVWFENSRSTSFSHCTFEQNRARESCHLFRTRNSSTVEFEQCTFRRNEVRFLAESPAGLSFESCAFKGNAFDERPFRKSD